MADLPSQESPLFTLRLPTTGGTLTCTSPSPKVYLLTLTSPPDNRLTTTVCQALLLALDILEHAHPPGVVITTSGITKFYSNGLDLEHATTTEGFWEKSLYSLFRRFLTYPMPTIALINGHAFAGGFMLAMHHDYRVFNPERGFLCLNELEFGVALYPPMSSVFRQKLPNPSTYRDIVLEARRYAAQDALKEGIVDTLGKLPETLQLVRERNLLTKASSGVYGELKAEMWRESVALLDGHQQNQKHQEGVRKRMDIEKEVGKRRVVEWQRSQTRSKL